MHPVAKLSSRSKWVMSSWKQNDAVASRSVGAFHQKQRGICSADARRVDKPGSAVGKNGSDSDAEGTTRENGCGTKYNDSRVGGIFVRGRQRIRVHFPGRLAGPYRKKRASGGGGARTRAACSRRHARSLSPFLLPPSVRPAAWDGTNTHHQWSFPVPPLPSRAIYLALPPHTAPARHPPGLLLLPFVVAAPRRYTRTQPNPVR
jgi:hypothetical protein